MCVLGIIDLSPAGLFGTSEVLGEREVYRPCSKNTETTEKNKFGETQLGEIKLLWLGKSHINFPHILDYKSVFQYSTIFKPITNSKL